MRPSAGYESLLPDLVLQKCCKGTNVPFSRGASCGFCSACRTQWYTFSYLLGPGTIALGCLTEILTILSWGGGWVGSPIEHIRTYI